MSAGSQRTVHFPAASAAETEDAAPTQPVDVQPGVVIWGRMSRAASHLQKQINHLPSAELDYHGTLRMIVTAAADVGDYAKELLKMIDEKDYGA
jgi:hypothetical protein